MSINAITLPPLIGICGAKGAGKDTVAFNLIGSYGYVRHAFADPIKAGLSTMFGVPENIFHDPAIKETPFPELLGRTPRYLMQTIGTEWGRDMVDEALWVKLLIATVRKEHIRGRHLVVVPDVRFDVEAEAIIEAGGIIWEVVRPDSPYAEGDSHRSEVGINPAFVTTQIKNTADIRMLHTQIGVTIARAKQVHRPDDDSAL